VSDDPAATGRHGGILTEQELGQELRSLEDRRRGRLELLEAFPSMPGTSPRWAARLIRSRWHGDEEPRGRLAGVHRATGEVITLASWLVFDPLTDELSTTSTAGRVVLDRSARSRPGRRLRPRSAQRRRP
jgi:hypothetical protein